MMKGVFTEDAALNPKLRPPPLLGVLFCLISMFAFICFLITFRLEKESLIMCLALVVFYSYVGTWEGSACDRDYPSTNWLIPIGIGSALLPLYIGSVIYVKIYMPYYLAVSGRTYDNVSPFAKPAEYADAGVMSFSQDAALDTSRSFGYKAQDFTYCVAPVVSRTASVHPDSAGPKVSFWAVGQDCCGNRNQFECDGAGHDEFRNAFAVKEPDKDVLTQFLVPKSNEAMYFKAIAAAKAVHNLRSADEENILLIRWTADPTSSLKVWYDRAIVGAVMSSVIYAIVISIVWTAIHIYYDRDIKRQAQGVPGLTPEKRQFNFGTSPFNGAV
jgi:hypothetical protein